MQKLVGERVEVIGDEAEGFPASFSCAIIASKGDNLRVQYEDFVEEDDITPLVEALPEMPDKLRPAQPDALQFTSWDQVKVGQAVDMRSQDVWWKGVVIRILPAGVQVYTPDVDNVVALVRGLGKLRPGYEWTGSCWRKRSVPAHVLREVEIKKQAADSFPAELAYEPTMGSLEQAALQPAAFAAAKPRPGSAQKRRRSSGISAGNAAGAAAALATTASGPLQPGIKLEPGAENAGMPSAKRIKSEPSQVSPEAANTASAILAAAVAAATGAPAAHPHQRASSEDVVLPRSTVPSSLLHAGARSISAPADLLEAAAAQAAAAAGTSKAGASARGPAQEEEEEAEEEAVLRRSRREGKQRVVYVDGIPVLKSNLYDLEQGEPSVFDKELAGGVELGPGVSLTAPARQRNQPAVPRAPKPPGQRNMDPVYQARMAHNASIRAGAQEFQSLGALYLQQYMDQLRPFITQQAVANIVKLAAQAPPGWKLPEPITTQPAAIVSGAMREYQLEGLQWLVAKFDHGINAILADEMGLGKTLQTISFLAALKWERQVSGPHLVVVPLSVMSSWLSEFRKWCPSLRVVRLHTSDPQEKARLRKEVLADPSQFDVAVTTYEMINSKDFGNSIKSTIYWRCLVLDEGHKVKNEDTLVSQGMRNISSQMVLMLTGTPVQNNLHELFALLNFMYPSVFTDGKMFDSAFDLQHQVVDDSKLTAAHYLLRPFVLRRLKEEVEQSLPPKVETRIGCHLSEMQTFWYRRLLLKDSALLQTLETETEGVKFEKDASSWRRLMMLVMQLRKVCNHPYMFSDAEPDFDGESTGEDIVTASGKMQVLDRLLQRLKARGHRVVLFSQFNITLNIIEDYLRLRGHRYRRLDGSTNRVQRMIDIEQFNRPGSKDFIYILNTRAGGLGVNLQTADTCIIYDSDWNPQWDVQAMARVHRIGQTKPVHVYRLVTEGTAEERVQRRAEAKLYLDQMVNRGSTAGAEELEGLGQQELLSMLKFGADRIFKNAAGQGPSDAQLEAILDRSAMLAQMAEKAGQQEGQKDKGRKEAAGTSAAAAAGAADDDGALVAAKHSALEFDAALPPVSSYMLDGIDYQQLKKIKASSLSDIARDYWDVQKRGRKERLMTIDGYQVLKENNYTMTQGGLSAWNEVLVAPKTREQLYQESRKKVQRAGTDYPHMDTCQICWDGGDLVCCDQCPCAYHPGCLGISSEELEAAKTWKCPLHYCAECGKGSAQAGNMLFRCEMCEHAYCEDHRPDEHAVTGESELYQALGQRHPGNACYILCSEDCKANRERLDPLITEVIHTYTEQPHKAGALVSSYKPLEPSKAQQQGAAGASAAGCKGGKGSKKGSGKGSSKAAAAKPTKSALMRFKQVGARGPRAAVAATSSKVG